MISIIFIAVVLLISSAFFSIDDSANKKLVEFIRSYGWQVEETPADITYLTIPEDFDAVYGVYESMQQSSGFEFAKFKGKKVVRYTYKVLNHEKSQISCVLAGVFVCDQKIIGADIFSPDKNSFIHSITEVSMMSN